MFMQRGATMYEHDLDAYRKRIGAFGWETLLVNDGHDLEEVLTAYEIARRARGRPTMIIAKTFKGKGVSFLEDEKGWHGKALDDDQLARLRSC
jgi:transketolase